MTERELTIFEAWDDFEKSVLDGLRGTMPWKEYNKLKQAKRDNAKGLLRETRIKKTLTKYAPERYEFRESVIIHET